MQGIKISQFCPCGREIEGRTHRIQNPRCIVCKMQRIREKSYKNYLDKKNSKNTSDNSPEKKPDSGV